MSALLEVHKFADRDDCLSVIGAYERSQPGHGAVVGDPFFDRRVMWISSFPDSENDVRRTLQRWRHRATAIASAWAGERLFSDTIQVVRWDGQTMPPHRDHCNMDGTPNPTPWREWAGIIYLNDDFLDGRLLFPETGEGYRPMAGSFLLFPGALLHSLESSAGGPRYTAPMWFSRSSVHEDPWAAVQF
ncbi:MAG TPA: 2OG-Fe(II) oxygenase [Candidatus Binataceae bacterium]|nr:2OG-Fe(II) oxygenase [Candidatus Binataceae bacterium]